MYVRMRGSNTLRQTSSSANTCSLFEQSAIIPHNCSGCTFRNCMASSLWSRGVFTIPGIIIIGSCIWDLIKCTEVAGWIDSKSVVLCLTFCITEDKV